MCSINLAGRKHMDQLNDLQRGMLDRNTILIEGNVDENMAEYVRTCINHLEVRDNPPVKVRITSNGGEVWLGLLIHDLLRLYPGKKTGVVMAFARSMGAIILQACDTRQCTRNSMVLIHHVNKEHISLDDLKDRRRLEKIRGHMAKEQEKLYEILEGRTKKPRSEIVKTCKKDRDMPAEEALSFGLIDEII